MQSTQLSSEEKLLAALCYWGCFLGFIPALIIWLMKKEQSPFLNRQGLQALLFLLATSLVLVVGLPLLGGVAGTVTFGLGKLLFGAVDGLLALLVFVYQIFLGYKCFQGEDVRFPFLSEMVEKNLGQNQ